jgi:succinylglutamic semialdehyde dehydrogenase
LVAHPGVDGVLFTGSADVGVAINRKLAGNPGKIVALEMGGNNPIVVIDTPRLNDAATLILQSAFTSAGQRCTAARRLIVKESVYEDLMAILLPMARNLMVGDPTGEPQPFMGPVIDNETADRLSESFLTLFLALAKALITMGLEPEVMDRTVLPTPAVLEAAE